MKGRLTCLLLLACGLPAQDFRDLDKQTTEFTLGNGLHFILMERHNAPVVSFETLVDAGSVDDPTGQSGLSRIIEQVAFNGTDSIGTSNAAAEKKALDDLEALYNNLDAELNKGGKASRAVVESLQSQIKAATDRAHSFSRPFEYRNVMESNGSAALTASAGQDATEFRCTLPSNRVELWFLMESQRFAHPVLRDFYAGRNALLEEYKTRVEGNLQGKLLQQLRETAFAAHPYRNPATGWPGDIQNLRREAALRFVEKYYVPTNTTIAIVGDIDREAVRKLAERYFGPLPGRPLPPSIRTVEPPQYGPKSAILEGAAQPAAMAGYKRPDQYDKDDAVFDVLATVLAGGRASLLNRDLVTEQRVAQSVQINSSFPGDRFASLFTFFVMPAQGKTAEEALKALDESIERLKTQRLESQVVDRAKTQTRASVIRAIDDNARLAALFASSWANFGEARHFTAQLNAYRKVTPEDIQRVMKTYFTSQNRTVAYSARAAAPQAPAAGGRR